MSSVQRSVDQCTLLTSVAKHSQQILVQFYITETLCSFISLREGAKNTPWEGGALGWPGNSRCSVDFYSRNGPNRMHKKFQSSIFTLAIGPRHFAIFGPISWVPKYKKYKNFQKKIKNTSWNWKSNMKMVLESSEPKENDKILKKKFHHFGGLRAPQNTPKTLKWGF